MAEQDKKDTFSGVLTEPNLGSGTSLASMMHTGLGLESPFMRESFLKRQVIVGTRFLGGSDELVEDLKKGSRITFLREPDNEFDPNAVMALDEQGRKLGYIPRRENELMGALMTAGKYFYGIITEPPDTDEYSDRRTPLSIWMDLYMREFPGPDDLYEIPLQGYRGSYIVTEFSFERLSGVLYITGFFAIKMIRGEERGTLSCNIFGEETTGKDIDPDQQEKMIKSFADFAGHLPIVTFNILGRKQDCLEETCDMRLGKPFSNRMIDTLQMAENHLPENNSTELADFADHLGITVHCDDVPEERCRIILKLYQRMEKSELKNRNSMISKATIDTKILSMDEVDDLLISDLGMTERTRNILYQNNIDMVRELMALSEKEAADLKYMDRQALRELKMILSTLKINFRSETQKPFLYRYPRFIRLIPKYKSDYWEYLFFLELITIKYHWFRPLRKRHLQPGKPILVVPKISKVSDLEDFIDKNVELVRGYTRDMASQLNDNKDEAFGLPGKPGDAEKIFLMADNMMKIYKRIILWIENMSSIDTDPKYRKAVLAFTRLGEEVCSFYDTLYQNCLEGIKSINDYLDGVIPEEDVDVHLDLKLAFIGEPLSELSRLLKELEQT